MIYGILNHNNVNCKFASSKEREEINLGDYVQSIGVKTAYQESGIRENQIELIEKYSICREESSINQVKENTVVTMNNVYSGGGQDRVIRPFPTIEGIIPLFIGFHCLDESIISENVEYFKRWQPIGCRDEKTKELLECRGVEAYLTGCSSILLPMRQETNRQNTIFCVDTPESLKEYIPSEYLKEAKFISQNIPQSDFQDVKEDTYFNVAMQYMKMYEEEAKLIITSKLHCAAPCLAMGIPVILAVENIDDRFGWIDKLLPIYTEWKTIDWSLQKRDISEAKQLLINVYRERINTWNHKSTGGNIEALQAIDSYYMNRTRNQYNRQKKNQIQRVVEQFENKTFQILIWGGGRTGGLLFDLIANEFPQIQVMGFIDSYKSGEYKGKPILRPLEIKKYEFDFIFLCSVPGREAAVNKMKELGLEEEKDYEELYFESVFSREKDGKGD